MEEQEAQREQEEEELRQEAKDLDLTEVRHFVEIWDGFFILKKTVKSLRRFLTNGSPWCQQMGTSLVQLLLFKATQKFQALVPSRAGKSQVAFFTFFFFKSIRMRIDHRFFGTDLCTQF